MIGKVYKCDVCGVESSAPIRWYVLSCGETRLGIFKWDQSEADKPYSLHVCGEGHAQVYISRWFEACLCSDTKIPEVEIESNLISLSKARFGS